MPWKNGGGITSELFKDTFEGDFNLRLSVARVEQDGDFSFFPGLKRHLLILEGGGICLQLESNKIVLTQETESFAFSGDEFIHCSLLKGPVLDFNIMINPEWGEAILKKNDPSFNFDGDLNFIYAIDLKTLIVFQKNEKPENHSRNYICIKIRKAD